MTDLRGTDASSSYAVASASVAEVLRDLARPLAVFQESGLKALSDSHEPELIEEALIADPRECDFCGGDVSLLRCPSTGRPHRRRLVGAAQKLLRLIGLIGGRHVLRPASLADRAGGDARLRPTRRMLINPQLLLLTFYYSAIPLSDVVQEETEAPESGGESSIDPVVQLYAKRVVSHLELVQAAVEEVMGALPPPAATISTTTHHHANINEPLIDAELERRIRGVFRGFSAAWRRYTRVATASLKSSGPNGNDEHESHRRQLIKSTRDAYVGAWRDHRHSPDNTDLTQVVQLLATRLVRLAGEEMVAALNTYLEATQDVQTSTSTRFEVLGGCRDSFPSLIAGVEDPSSSGTSELSASTSCKLTSTPHDSQHSSPLLPQIPFPASAAEPTSLTHAAYQPSSHHYQPLQQQAPTKGPMISTRNDSNEYAAQSSHQSQKGDTISTSSQPTHQQQQKQHVPPHSVTGAPLSRAPPPTSAQFASPNLLPALPPTTYSDNNTSDSEGESGLPLSEATSSIAGPPVPPGWYVDASGRSRPPLSQLSEEQRRAQERREHYARSEFRAKQAFNAALNITQEKSSDERVIAEVIRTLNDATLDSLADDINKTPPDLTQVPRMINLVVDGLLDALPVRSRSMVEQEMRDVLDWGVMRQAVMSRPESVAAFTQYVVGKVMAFGAPARNPELQEKLKAQCADLERGAANSNLGMAVANTFRFMLAAVKQLREDVARYMLLMINDELRRNAEPIIQGFITTFLPPPATWMASRHFLQSFINTEQAKRWASAPAAARNVVSATVPEKRVRGALLYGTLDLLCSSHRTAGNRWESFPTELFFFEKSEIFRAANVVQETTLLLLLSGTVSMMLRGKGLRADDVNRVLRRIQQRAVAVLSEPVTLQTLKVAISDEVQDQLASLATPVTLSEENVQVLQSTMERMTETNGALYASFEKRAIGHLESEILRLQGEADTRRRSEGSGEAVPGALPPALPSQSASTTHELLNQTASRLARLLAFHWSVYRPFYMELISFLQIDEGEPVDGVSVAP